MAFSTIDGDYGHVYSSGNRVTASGPQTFNGDYYTDVYNRLVGVGWATKFQYDDEGNLTFWFSDLNGDGEWEWGEIGVSYTWDNRNRLVEAKEYDDQNVLLKDITYGYDAFNRLIYRKEVGASTNQTVFINDGGQVVLEFDKDGTGDVAATDLSHRYLWGEAVDQLLADEQVDWAGNSTYEGEVLWAMTDSLGSVGDVIDSDGNLRLHRQYDSFGNVVGETHYNSAGSTVTSGTGFIDEAFGYTGRWLDKATKLQNNLNRWCDSYEGRFLSEDPAEQGTNPYEYAGNSPGNFIDPEGLDPVPGGNNYGGGGAPSGFGGGTTHGSGAGGSWGTGYDADDSWVRFDHFMRFITGTSDPYEIAKDGKKYQVQTGVPPILYWIDGLGELGALENGARAAEAASAAERALECEKAASRAKFGSAELGNYAHSRFEQALLEQTGTKPKHWFMRTRPGMTGVDATYRGPEELFPGFRHAELKPLSRSGFNTFQRQLNRWALPEDTQLWWYNEHAIIGSSGTNW